MKTKEQVRKDNVSNASKYQKKKNDTFNALPKEEKTEIMNNYALEMLQNMREGNIETPERRI